MRFFADHDVYQVTVAFLRQQGHDVVTAGELGLHISSDRNLLKEASKQNRLFITRDKDFGMLVFLENELNPGVIFLRISPSTISKVHDELIKVLGKYNETDLKKVFCVIEPHRHRIRFIKP